jgi:hypothetical protein
MMICTFGSQLKSTSVSGSGSGAGAKHVFVLQSHWLSHSV